MEFSITLSLYFINQHITGYHRIDVEAIPGAPEQIKTLKTSKPFRNHPITHNFQDAVIYLGVTQLDLME